MDPNLMSQMFSNPDTMKSMEEMMQNPDIMENAMKMMSNPDIMKMFGGANGGMPDMASMFGGGGGGGGVGDESEPNLNGSAIEVESESESDYEELPFNVDDQVVLSGLKNEEFNGKNGVVTEYFKEKNRYVVFIEDMDKTVSLREENLTLLNENENENENEESNADLEIEELESADINVTDDGTVLEEAEENVEVTEAEAE
jgi:hypothetical protein